MKVVTRKPRGPQPKGQAGVYKPGVMVWWALGGRNLDRLTWAKAERGFNPDKGLRQKAS